MVGEARDGTGNGVMSTSKPKKRITTAPTLKEQIAVIDDQIETLIRSWTHEPQGSNLAHCCATDGPNIWPIYGYKLLTNVFPPDQETKICTQCASKMQSGEEISVMIAPNQKAIVRPKVPAAYKGSMDPFEDMVTQLMEMNVMYLLTIGIQGQSALRYWTNAARYGRPGLELFKRQMNDIIAAIEKKIAESEQQRMKTKCPNCDSCDTKQIDEEKAVCLTCGEVFINPSQPLEEAA